MTLVQVVLNLQVISELKLKALNLPPVPKCLHSTVTKVQACHFNTSNMSNGSEHFMHATKRVKNFIL